MSLRSSFPLGTLLVCGAIAACDEPAETGPTDSTRPAIGSCTYVNPFSKLDECKLYVGASFTAETAATDCESYVFGAPGTFVEGGTCEYEETLGTCTVSGGTDYAYELVSPGTDAYVCEDTKRGCEVFAQGTFEPGSTCDGVVVGGGGNGSVFVQPYLVCKDPLDGEAPGTGPNGQVCTWTLISASTEEGRRYEDYASCEDVRTQRPYYAAPVASTTPAGDARLSDAAYMAEVQWAREQVEASACVCCHSSPLAPDGPSQWFVEAEGVWLDSISDPGLAMMAGLADSTALGAFPPEDNNGFDRNVVGVPTTDNQRMQALLLGEWSRRGFTEADAQSIEPFGGPLVTQLSYEPGPCDSSQGVAADGTLKWTGGTARYLYVMDATAANPGVPPNLDEPSGTVWLVDVPSAEAPFASGVRYGEVTGKLRQRVPSGSPAPLVKGETYYLYVLADVGLPITRCLFTAP